MILIPQPTCWPTSRLEGSLRDAYFRAWRRHFQNVLDATAVARQALNLTDVREQVRGQARGCYG